MGQAVPIDRHASLLICGFTLEHPTLNEQAERLSGRTAVNLQKRDLE